MTQTNEVSNSAPCQSCHSCGAELCIRQSTISMALGEDEEQFCLKCLGERSGTDPLQVLKKTKGYVLSRQCFKKEWNKYPDRSYCPFPASCWPDACFEE